MKALAPLLLLALSCSCPAKPATTTTTTSPGSGSADPVDPATPPANPDTPPANPSTGSGSAAEPAPTWSGGPGIGENCGANDSCGKGLSCVKYYGIAGARGPEFKSCEIRCADGKSCPDGLKCITIADGPGQVCRK
jgi:hypothetical protein